MKLTTSTILPGLALLTIALAAPAAGQEPDNELAKKAYGVLEKYCFKCHGNKYEVPGFNVLDREVLLQPRPNLPTYIVSGEPEKSFLWKRVRLETPSVSRMPPEDVAQPAPEEVALLKDWIAAGAPFPKEVDGPRPFVTEQQILQTILTHLRRLPVADRPHQRYFSLAHLHNNPYVTDYELRLYRAAFVKLVNSLTRISDPVYPELIDAPSDKPYEGLIFNLNLRAVDWKLDVWRKVMENYPYGLEWRDPGLRELSGEIDRELGALVTDGIPFVRVDWFVAKASRPPLYHLLLDLPDTVEALEKNQLGVDSQRDFTENQLLRAGFAGSGVSKSNRLVDRHGRGTTKYYYRSYDFAKSFERAVLFRFPLGPNFQGNAFNQHAFEADGGEMIWQLPNGMQAYMITDKDGKRLDAAPVEIVRDLTETSGTPQVVNGISCLGCHRTGIHAYTDSVRDSFPLDGNPLDKVLALYPKNDALQRVIARDQKSFMDAQEQILGPYLQHGKFASTPVAEFPEPISKLVNWYDKDIGPEEAWSELGLDPQSRPNVRTSQPLLQLGLGVFARGNKIPRAMWDTLEESSASVFQRAAESVNHGTPKRAPKPAE
jgi:serine/threonine-protein kinase